MLEKSISISLFLCFYAILNVGKSFFLIRAFRREGDFKDAFFSFLLILALAFVNLDIASNNNIVSLIALVIVFPITLSLYYENQILPELDERLLHLISIIYLYNLFVFTSGGSLYFLLLLSTFPVYLIFVINLIDYYHSDAMKSLLYFFFLLMLVLIELFHLKGLWLDYKDDGNIDTKRYLSLFFLTGGYFYIIVYGTHLYLILNDDKQKRRRSIILSRNRETQLKLFVEKVRDEQSSWKVTILISLLSFISLGLNYFYHIISHDLITELWMSYVFVIHIRRQKLIELIKTL
ncbi:MAG: hypothetical protein H7A25_20495 [Leptospiraceae bacterium]|nr:hypothetical protein [Leptospiraceae bacterium]